MYCWIYAEDELELFVILTYKEEGATGLVDKRTGQKGDGA